MRVTDDAVASAFSDEVEKIAMNRLTKSLLTKTPQQVQGVLSKMPADDRAGAAYKVLGNKARQAVQSSMPEGAGHGAGHVWDVTRDAQGLLGGRRMAANPNQAAVAAGTADRAAQQQGVPMAPRRAALAEVSRPNNMGAGNEAARAESAAAAAGKGPVPAGRGATSGGFGQDVYRRGVLSSLLHDIGRPAEGNALHTLQHGQQAENVSMAAKGQALQAGRAAGTPAAPGTAGGAPAPAAPAPGNIDAMRGRVSQNLQANQAQGDAALQAAGTPLAPQQSPVQVTSAQNMPRDISHSELGGRYAKNFMQRNRGLQNAVPGLEGANLSNSIRAHDTDAHAAAPWAPKLLAQDPAAGATYLADKAQGMGQVGVDRTVETGAHFGQTPQQSYDYAMNKNMPKYDQAIAKFSPGPEATQRLRGKLQQYRQGMDQFATQHGIQHAPDMSHMWNQQQAAPQAQVKMAMIRPATPAAQKVKLAMAVSNFVRAYEQFLSRTKPVQPGALAKLVTMIGKGNPNREHEAFAAIYKMPVDSRLKIMEALAQVPRRHF